MKKGPPYAMGMLQHMLHGSKFGYRPTVGVVC